MPILPEILQAASERPHGATAWIYLWDVEVAKRTVTLAPFVVRMTSSHVPVTWKVAEAEEPVVFYPYPFSMTDIEQDNEGNLPSLELTVDNTTRTLMRYLHAGGGFEGNRATCYLTHEDALQSNPQQQIVFQFQVASAIASDSAVSFRLSMVNLNEKRLPQSRFVQGNCRWKFGGIECAYPITPTASFTSCGKTIDDCSARGDDEVARGLPRLHPRRFGGFPGISTQRS